MDTIDFQFSAPTSYAFRPSEMSMTAPMPADRGVMATGMLTRMTTGIYYGDYPLVATGPVKPCTVGSDSAAYLTFTSGPNVGVMILWLHFGDAYALTLYGQGGLDPRAISDAQAVLGSLAYAHNVPPPGYTPPSTP